MKELYLIYINKIGINHKLNYLYEFIFSDTIENIDGNFWDLVPASNRPEPPHKHLIKSVGLVETSLKLDVIQESDTFALWDAIDGIIALGWENINAYETYPDTRLSFRFGDVKTEVIDKLITNNLIITFKNEK
jgi:hypothetical protein